MKAFLIPGSGEDLKSRDYALVLKMYKSLGYESHFVPIKWSYRTIDDWVGEVRAQISEKEIQNSLLSGFSFGAMIALVIAAQTNPKQLLLFSLSPYFKEDFPLPKSYEDWAGKRRIENFQKLSFNQLAMQIKCPTTLFLGSEEKERSKYIPKRLKEAHKKITGSKMVIANGAGHDVANPKYVETIRETMR